MIERKSEIEEWFKNFYAHGKFNEDEWQWQKFAKHILLEKLTKKDYKGE